MSNFLMEKFYRWLSWHLPERLVYFAAMRLLSYATTGLYKKTVVPDLPFMEALKRWEERWLNSCI